MKLNFSNCLLVENRQENCRNYKSQFCYSNLKSMAANAIHGLSTNVELPGSENVRKIKLNMSDGKSSKDSSKEE